MSRISAELERSDRPVAGAATGPLTPCAECGYFNSAESPICFDCGRDFLSAEPLTRLARPPLFDRLVHLTKYPLIICVAVTAVCIAARLDIPALPRFLFPAAFIGLWAFVAWLRVRNDEWWRGTLEQPPKDSARPGGVLQMALSQAVAARESASAGLERISRLSKATDLDREERAALYSSYGALKAQWERAEAAITEARFARWQNRVQGYIQRLLRADLPSADLTNERRQLQLLEDEGRGIKVGAEVLAESAAEAAEEGVVERAGNVCTAVDTLISSLRKCARMFRRAEVVGVVSEANASLAGGARVVSLTTGRQEGEMEAAGLALELAGTNYLDTELLVERWRADELRRISQRQEKALDERH